MRLTAIAVAALLAGCGADASSSPPPGEVSPSVVITTTTSTTETSADTSGDTSVTAPAAVERLVPTVTETFPHDPGSYTQGLLLEPDGTLLESAGLYGESDLRRVELATGAVLESVEVAPEYFAEGLTVVDDRAIQLTWQEQTAIVYDAATLEPVGTFTYDGEGWGLCLLGDRLVMSNGSDQLTFRDPATFESLGEVAVTLDGAPRDRLNELECVDGAVWANVWQTDLIVRIDPSTGSVTGVVDATGLLDRSASPAADGLNGIAYDAATDTFLLTGKLWPTLFRVRFIPA